MLERLPPGRFFDVWKPASRIVSKLVLLLPLISLLLTVACGQEALTLATTTSTYDSGLLNVLLPPFEKANHVKVKVVAVGTGQALALGRRGDADVVLVHARAQEDKFVAQGHGIDRRDVMYNDFVIVGPPSDPAGIKGMKSAAAAFARIAQAKATFVSRGDDSGTHSKEKAIWAKAGLSPSSGAWYLSVGQGMGQTLTLAGEKGAYTLSDRGTYLAYQGKLNLTILVEGDEMLFNPYGVMAVNPSRHPQIKYDLALKFIDYITSPEARRIIAEFGKEKYGQPLFFPLDQER
jgi:tungstate transport system substrate-binding protein